MDSINKLTKLFSEFPGIGPRQAKRFVYFLLTRNEAYVSELLDLVKELKKNTRLCQDCFRYFPVGTNQSNICDICRSTNRNKNVLMIVSRDVDLENIEKSHSFDGQYFVLGGSVPILDKEPEKRVRLKELLNKIDKTKPAEIILGLNANSDGDYTGQIISEAIKQKNQTVKISHLGRGLSTGTELEYSDADTIKSALENRR